MQIAVYGKGGIGKSTISANLTAALCMCGLRVLQIGCDPKHDSTRLLHHGQKVSTVLDYLLNTPKDEQKLEDVLMRGFGGSGCVEAGGPKPGKGCAGRGILTAFEFLDRYHFRGQYDTIVYDVLGDVVCGGFAVPVRSQYADAVFLVTSGERMSIYAANNILQGIYNLNPHEKRIAGIIYNSRGIGDDKKRVELFAQAVGLPICVSVPRSSLFADAESLAQTVVEMAPDSREAELFSELAARIKSVLTLYPANPLNEEQMEYFMQGKLAASGFGAPKTVPAAERNPDSQGPALAADDPVRGVSGSAVSGSVSAAGGPDSGVQRSDSDAQASLPAAETKPKPQIVPAKKRALSDPFSRVPLFGCAFNGAVALSIHVKDAAVLAHAPKSCVWYSMNGFTGYSRRGLYDRGIIYPAFIPQHFDSTDMTVQDAIFGGVENAREHALKLCEQGIKYIIAVTACVPGLSGDDLEPVKQELAARGVEMVIVKTDGITQGDYNEGMAYCYRILAKECVRKDRVPEEDTINLVYEKTWSSKTDQNYMIVDRIFRELGIRVNCRFVCATSMEKIHDFLKGKYSLLVQDDDLGQEIKQTFITEYGAEFLPDKLPKGFSETAHFTRMLGEYYHKEDKAERLICRQQAVYRAECEKLKACFAGKKTVIFLNGGDFDWVFELAEDIGMDVAKAICIGNSKTAGAGWNRRFSEKWDNDRNSFRDSLTELAPDLVLLNDFSALAEVPDGIRVINLMREAEVGFFTGIHMAQEWKMTLGNKLEGGWRHDRALFEKHYC